jgi:hypothetical protein
VPNIGPFLIVESRELWLKPKPNSSVCLGILKQAEELEQVYEKEEGWEPFLKEGLFLAGSPAEKLKDSNIFTARGALFFGVFCDAKRIVPDILLAS